MPPPAELVQPYGYPLESHTVQTTDGYLLGVFRLPRGFRSDAPATHRSVLCAMSARPAPYHWLAILRLTTPARPLAVVVGG
jgi:Partial alpha/beta-hydrolase lipase region